MGPVELLYITIAFIFGMIGIVRGYHKELGNSIIFMYVIAAMGFLDERVLNSLFERAGTSILGLDAAGLNSFLTVAYTLIFVIVVFISYQGKTFDYSLGPAHGVLGFFFSLGVGLFNGYLVAGTLWYYMNKFQYPLGAIQQPLTATGEAMLAYLPQNLFDNPVYWAIPATVLMLLRIIR